MQTQQQNHEQTPTQENGYYSYATTTAHIVDPWSFNHATLLANLSQLPPDLLSSLLPRLSQAQQQQDPQIAAQKMSALAAAAVAAAAAATAGPMGTAQTQQAQHSMHTDHTFAGPVVPLQQRPQQGEASVNDPSNMVLPSISSFTQHAQQPGMASLPNGQLQQQHHSLNGYSGNMFHGNSSLQPLILPPPSPNILSYYTTDPMQWMSLLGQHAYQPQAYHYDYPLPPHQLPFSFSGQQQQQQSAFGLAHMQKNDPALATVAAAAAAAAAAAQGGGAANGPGMLLTQQYTPQAANNLASNQNNMAAVAAAQIVAAAAAASGQYSQSAGNGGTMAYHALQPTMQFNSQQQQQQANASYQPAQRTSSLVNHPLLTQPSSLNRPEFASQAFPKPLGAGVHSQHGTEMHGGQNTQYPTSALASGADLLSTFQQPQQQQQSIVPGAQGFGGFQASQMAPALNRYAGSAAYGSALLNSSYNRPQSYSGSRTHGSGLSSYTGMSLANKASQDVASTFGGTTFAGNAKPLHSAATIPYLAASGVALGPAGSAAGNAADFVPGTCVKRQLALSDTMRDHILQSAHQIYSTNPRNPVLIEMLLCLHQLHPKHLPTLLLLACAYFSNNQPEKSLEYNELILEIDPNYVEAMSNIGTTLRSMGKSTEAESWWWHAVKLRPGYWDAVENLMGVLLNPALPASASKNLDTDTGKPQQQQQANASRCREVLELCEFVENSLRIGESPSKHGNGVVTKYQVPDKQLSRLVSLLHTKGNLNFALSDIAGARRSYEKAMEVVLGGYTFDETIMRIAYAGSQEGINQMFHQQLNNPQPLTHSLDIHNLPLTLLAPESAVRILQVIFPETGGVLPGLETLASKNSASAQLQHANQLVANLMLLLARMHQDHAFVTQPLSIVLPLYYMSLALVPSPSTCNNLGIILSAIPSPSTPTMVPSLQGGHQAAQAPMGTALAMQYYTHGLTLDSRHPHLYTNLGSLLKDLGYLAEAVRMYEKAVEFNPVFDVALANLGNAIKDMGRVQDSVPWYLRAVQASPNFVEAVCGLANAMAGVCDWRARDGLYTEISVRWRASALANDETAVKIFQVMSRGKRPNTKEFAGKLRQLINYVEAPSPKLEGGVVDKRRGWMNRVVEIADQQLSEGKQWGRGLLLVQPAADEAGSAPGQDARLARPSSSLLCFLDSLCQLLPRRTTCPLSPLTRFLHQARDLVREVDSAASDNNVLSDSVLHGWRYLARQIRNEGGWAMRLVERAVVVLQRQWYWDVQHRKQSAIDALSRPYESTYQRPTLPAGMVAPAVPTVLPFHTFTYPLDAREVRLISHRNALRVSFTTLGGSAPWLPAHVYPPPSPPEPHIRIGYVSSDFNNHPTSHLMQSVFEMHNRRKFRVYCYATTPPDGTEHRQKIEQGADVFINCAAWSTQRIVEQIVSDKIHLLVNLNGYTKGARNEIFAARPAPVLVSFLGFAGTLGSGWCDYVVTDPIVCPPWTVRSEVRAERYRRANGKTAGERPEMQEIGHSQSQSRNAFERYEMVERTAHMALSDSSDSASDAGSDTMNDGEADQDQVAPGSQLRMGRTARQREWQEELRWDTGELDPEEDGAATGELPAFAAGSEAKADTRRTDEAGVNNWVYTERMMYMPHTYFVNDYRQGFREDEELREVQSAKELWMAEQDARYKMRRELFPQLSDDVFIFANFNQLYKIDPTLFRLWLRILERVPNSIIWLLRFPAAGEEHLHRVAVEWAGEEVARRVVFTDVAPKHMHIKRGRIADAFLDTTECNAHTTAVDILWSGTPVLTWPRHEHKQCSRVAASVACATGQGRQMVVSSGDEYVDRAVEWAQRASREYRYDYPPPDRPSILDADPQTGLVKHCITHGPAMDIRLQLFMARDSSRLFDTQRWTRNLEKGYEEAWRRWVTGEDEFDGDDVDQFAQDNTLSSDIIQPEVDACLDKSSRRKARWSRRIAQQIDAELATATGRQRSVYAPRGRCIWISDDDDGMPSQTWIHEMLGW
ncbi:hypothetical protein COEREDRAFT_82252 [Coemansia reversa NRRL 1564]|uniref:protein O-GlcNAc transferase n=1 Tax=Coemansia reversa (strain ATCC 12441 / NRRL 1564) TaxID=763665 RepID=A0A2G5B8I0_COERN|nr:hypothetical protein COEREDRAFT_82252 [Coemansia reversa NRRL 1564]|eukprot:PIA15037.1 hypothetical protein COEREDRAFT_82252 [Coemansia reversa NRRL 1564]